MAGVIDLENPAPVEVPMTAENPFTVSVIWPFNPVIEQSEIFSKSSITHEGAVSAIAIIPRGSIVVIISNPKTNEINRFMVFPPKTKSSIDKALLYGYYIKCDFVSH